MSINNLNQLRPQKISEMSQLDDSGLGWVFTSYCAVNCGVSSLNVMACTDTSYMDTTLICVFTMLAGCIYEHVYC